MTTYRIQVFGTCGGLIAERSFICNDDSVAVALAARLMPQGGQAEIWESVRLVGKVSVLIPNSGSGSPAIAGL